VLAPADPPWSESMRRDFRNGVNPIRKEFGHVAVAIIDEVKRAAYGEIEVTRFCRHLQMLAPACVVMIAFSFAADSALIEPHSPIIDRSPSKAQANSQVIGARR
jgi:hypothetical protein